MPLTAAGGPMPPAVRLCTARTQATVGEGVLVAWAAVGGPHGLPDAVLHY